MQAGQLEALRLGFSIFVTFKKSLVDEIHNVDYDLRCGDNDGPILILKITGTVVSLRSAKELTPEVDFRKREVKDFGVV